MESQPNQTQKWKSWIHQKDLLIGKLKYEIDSLNFYEKW